MKFQVMNRTGAAFLSPYVVKTCAFKIVTALQTQLKKSNKLAGRRLDAADEVTLVFVGRAEMKKLNFRYRKKNSATDILSFAPVEECSLGELVFCVPVLRFQAKEHQLVLKEEFAYLLIHGLLHLLDYDHETNDTAARRMYRLQDGIFEKLRK